MVSVTASFSFKEEEAATEVFPLQTAHRGRKKPTLLKVESVMINLFMMHFRDLKEKNPTTGFEIFSKKPRVQASKSSETLDQNYANDHPINNLSSKDNFKNSLSSEQPKSKKGDVKQSSMRMMELRPMPKSFMPYNRENIEKINYCCSSSDSYSSQCYNRQPSLKIKPQLVNFN